MKGMWTQKIRLTHTACDFLQQPKYDWLGRNLMGVFQSHSFTHTLFRYARKYSSFIFLEFIWASTCWIVGEKKNNILDPALTKGLFHNSISPFELCSVTWDKGKFSLISRFLTANPSSPRCNTGVLGKVRSVHLQGTGDWGPWHLCSQGCLWSTR